MGLFEAVTNIVSENIDKIKDAFSDLPAEWQEVAADSYNKVAGFVSSVEEYANALKALSTDQFNKYMELINAVETLKNLSAEIQNLKSHFNGVKFKDFLSGDNKSFAISLAGKTADFINLFNQTIGIINDLIRLFGDGLKDKLRSQNIPVITNLINI